ncbi:glycosyl hydrolase family 8 [Kribbella deserti]|uniref:Glycosyl hydrolase family 8 n=1 Tax=Kribbella deserti TaxID=1926257 RepID=A0ABV6QSW1_9ACTN
MKLTLKGALTKGAVLLTAGLLLLPIAQADAADVLLSQGKAATSSSIEDSGFEAGRAVDGNTATRWASLEGHDPEWIAIDLGATAAINRVKLTWEAAYGKSYKIQTSLNGTTWTDIFSTTTGNGAIDDLTVSGTGRYVRLYGTARGTAWGYSLWEFQVYGTTGGGDDPQPPTAPTNLTSTGVTSSTVGLSWGASTDNVGVTGYTIYRNGTAVGTTAGTTYTDMGLAASTAYTYTVKASDQAGNMSVASNAVTATTSGGTGGAAVPFGSHVIPYAAGMLKPSGTQATLDQKVVDYYQRWKTAFLKQNCGNGWYQVISPDASHPYVGEAQGYGMVISATMAGADPAAKTIFDGLLKYVLAHPSQYNSDLHAAEQDTSCNSDNGSDSATDADLDIAYGLLLADRQWGSSGTYNYKSLAIRRINAIKASIVNPTTKLLRMGDWSTSGGKHYYISRTSDWMVDHFRAFRKATGDSSWDTVRTAHQNVIASLQSSYAPSTGLLPDFVINTNTSPRPATGEVLESPNDGKYWWNACRVPWRIGADAVTSADAKSLAAARKLNTWVKSKTGGNPSNIGIGYQLNGAQIEAGSDACYFASFAVAAMTDSGSQAWLDALWNKMLVTPIDTSSYYAASVQLQVMIAASHNHWVP